MVPEFVDRTRGSKWNRALPGRPTPQSLIGDSSPFMGAFASR